MAAISTPEKNRCARVLANRIFVEAVATATLTHDDLVAAVGAVDAMMEGLPTALGNQSQSIALNINAGLPDPFKSTATVSQKSALVAVWAGVKYGLL